MPSARKFRYTMFTVAVLTEDEDPYEPESLEQIHHDITTGDAVGDLNTGTSIVVEGKAVSDILKCLGSEPGFFQLDDDGNDVED